ncbi:MAG: sigma-70 family RNA polymerase sigma factor [Gemmatimonadales bacterium]|nr:sigma-70 family RNA polymerase sigma factor [Gemmatimonadales bacterium]NIN12837.1 sigma-70 family RNA polymerase sigma factor [Gemmatimonadales bacterium]NIN48765.1 sigma-70 family RNA polymerase sigma factor [Gemmatimonadales bacterium]NIP06229.1 sigma-70 family RNA polymerase sigma factor [Gemmatimonadales bacterium]NIR01414.1 sigma-70 family RNA polymerase sigma factor [Gemmatimonadales bacterium]
MSDTLRLSQAVTPLVRKAQAGDREAFRELVRACYQQIYRWALGQTGDPDDADDVTQEVLVRLHRQLSRYRAQARFTTWLYQVTRNAAADLHRRRKRQERVASRWEAAASPEETEDQLEAIHQAEVMELVKSFFDELPDRQREVFDLVDLQGLTPTEVGKILQMNPVTVRAHLFRARRSIRGRIMAEHPELMEEAYR